MNPLDHNTPPERDMGEEAFHRLIDVLESVSIQDLQKILVQTAALLNHRMPGSDPHRHMGMVWPEGKERIVCFAAGWPAERLRKAFEKVKAGVIRDAK